MVIYRKVTNLKDFVEEFEKKDRSENFSIDGLIELFYFFIENFDDYLLDVIEICCNYSEVDEDELRELEYDNKDNVIKKLDNGKYLIINE